MTLSQSPTAESQQVDRPSGVWLLCLLNGIFWGIMPILDTAASHYWQPALLPSLSVETLITSITLPALIAVAAFGAWKGSSPARVSLVALLTLHSVVVVSYYVVTAVSSYPGLLLSFRIVPFVVKAYALPFLWVGINAWYFLGQRPHAIYAMDRSQMPKLSIRSALAAMPVWLWGSIGGILVFWVIFSGLYLLQLNGHSGQDWCKQLDSAHTFQPVISPLIIFQVLMFPGHWGAGGVSRYIFAALPLAFVGAVIPTAKGKRYGIRVLVLIFIVLVLFYLFGLLRVVVAFGLACAG